MEAKKILPDVKKFELSLTQDEIEKLVLERVVHNFHPDALTTYNLLGQILFGPGK